jgi:hypothetical protein
VYFPLLLIFGARLEHGGYHMLVIWGIVGAKGMMQAHYMVKMIGERSGGKKRHCT